MNPRAIALTVAAVLLLSVPYWVPGVYYVNVASQILFFAIFALGLNVLVGYGGLVSLGHAGLFGVAAYAAGYMLHLGYGHPLSIIVALVIGIASMAMFAVLSLRSTGIGFIMITLALGQILWGLAYRWISVTGGDNGITLHGRPAPFGFELDTANSFYYMTLVIFVITIICCCDLRALAARRRADGHTRPAAPHERSRLSCVGHPLLGVPFFGPAHSCIGNPVCLLQPIHQPADARAHLFRRSAPDGDLRRRRHAVRPDRRCRTGRSGEKRSERLHRALEHATRRDLRCHRHPDAGRPGARVDATLAAALAQARQGSRRRRKP